MGEVEERAALASPRGARAAGRCRRGECGTTPLRPVGDAERSRQGGERSSSSGWLPGGAGGAASDDPAVRRAGAPGGRVEGGAPRRDNRTQAQPQCEYPTEYKTAPCQERTSAAGAISLLET